VRHANNLTARSGPVKVPGAWPTAVGLLSSEEGYFIKISANEQLGCTAADFISRFPVNDTAKTPESTQEK
jgi:hypothetical protein